MSFLFSFSLSVLVYNKLVYVRYFLCCVGARLDYLLFMMMEYGRNEALSLFIDSLLLGARYKHLFCERQKDLDLLCSINSCSPKF